MATWTTIIEKQRLVLRSVHKAKERRRRGRKTQKQLKNMNTKQAKMYLDSLENSYEKVNCEVEHQVKTKYLF